MKTAGAKRVYYLDWLRVFGILSVLIYHSSRFFNMGDWHVKNPTWYPWLEVWNRFAITWLMPLMFVISGASLYFATGKGGAGKFVKDKVLRLLIPIVVCDLTHATLQVYLERLSHGQFTGTFFQFWPLYFQGVYDGSNPASGNFAVTGVHLWYLFWLFLFSMLLYPLMRWLRGGGQRLLSRIGRTLAGGGLVYGLALPSMLLLALVSPDSRLISMVEAGWPLVIYFWFTFAGFLLFSHEALPQRIGRLRWLSLALALALMAAAAFLAFFQGEAVPGSLRYSLAVALHNLSAWCCVLACFGFASRHVSQGSPRLSYANEAVLPFYILHQTVLLIVGFFVVQWAIPDLNKWLVILLGSFTLIMLIYEYLVRRFNPMRFLFGMKALPKPRPVPPPEAALGTGRS